MKTIDITFVRCGGNLDDITETVEIHEDDSVADVVNRAASQYCPADVAERRQDLDFDDPRRWDGTDLSADCMGEGFFFRDHGISTSDRWYGQIFRACSKRQGNGNPSVTGRVYVDVEHITDALDEMEACENENA